MKVHLKSGLAIGVYFFSMFGIYAYSFFMGSVWVEKEIYNDGLGRNYTGGDVLSCFFGVLYAKVKSGPQVEGVA